MSNILMDVLLASGTGIIEGFFRLPVNLITYSDYQYHKEKLQLLEKDSTDYANLLVSFGNLRLKLGDKLEFYEKYYENPVIKLSTRDGKFLGTYLIQDMYDPGGGEDDGEFFLTLKSSLSGIVFEVQTEQIVLNSNYGRCFIYLNGKEEVLLWNQEIV